MPSTIRARLAGQSRLSSQETQTGKMWSEVANGNAISDWEEPASAPGVSAAAVATPNAPPSSSEAVGEARNILELEGEPLPSAPMMTYQKYLTMQEKRVKVTIRYSAEAGLRPFYLTVANQIKSAYPDVLLEKRIMPRSEVGGEDSIFEVVIDGKTVIGKKDTKMLKVASRSSRKSSGGDDKGEDRGKDENGKGSAKSGSGDTNTPDIAGGRSIFVSLEKLDHELIKARKKRRPNTMYKSKEIAIGAAPVTSDAAGPASAVGSQLETGMTEAVIRLERLKALSTRNRLKST